MKAWNVLNILGFQRFTRKIAENVIVGNCTKCSKIVLWPLSIICFALMLLKSFPLEGIGNFHSSALIF